VDGSNLVMVRKSKGLLHTAVVSSLAMITAACSSIDSKATQATADSAPVNPAPAPRLPMPVATLGEAAVEQDNLEGPAVSTALKEIDKLNQQQQYEQSLTLTQKLLKQYPDNPDLALMEGVLFNQLERTEEAEQVFLRLSEKHPELPEPLNNLAVIYVNRGDLNRAISTLQKAFETHPSYARVQSNLRTLYTTLASQAYNRALNLGSQAPAPVLAALDRIPEQSAVNAAEHGNAQSARIIRTSNQTDSASTLTSEERASIQADIIRAAQATPVAPAEAAAVATTQAAAVAEQPATETVAEPPVAETAVAEAPAVPADTPAVIEKAEPVVAKAAPVAVPEEKAAPAPVTEIATATRQAESTALAQSEVLDPRETLENRTKDWAAAWSAKDVPAYLAFYVDNFRPANRMSNKRWKAQRKQRLTKPKQIQVAISGISIRIKNEKLADVSFTQRYRADKYSDKVIKTLTYKKVDGDWKIRAEVSRKAR